MTFVPIPGAPNAPQLNLSTFTETDIPVGSNIRCVVTASGVNAGGNPDTETRTTQEVVIEAAGPPTPGEPIIRNLTLSTPVAGEPVTGTATIEYIDADDNGAVNIDDLIADGWSVEWNWSFQQAPSEGDVTLTYSIEYEDFRGLGNDVYRTDNYAWTIRSASGLPIEHGTFIDGTPWVIDTGDLELIDVTPREREITTTDFYGDDATGTTSRTVINPDFGKEICDQDFGPDDPPPFVYENVFCRAEGERNPGAATTVDLDLISDRKTHPFDFRAGAGRKQKVSNFGKRYDPTQAIDVTNLDTGISLRAGDMVVTQTGLDESNFSNRPFDGSYGTLTVMSPDWVGRSGTEEYYRPPVNWDGFNETLRAERSVMALKREVRWYENPITPPDYDYDSDTKTWDEVYLNGKPGGQDGIRNTTDNGTDPIKIKNPGMIQTHFYISDPGGNEGNGVKNLAMTWDTYANRGSKDEEAYLLCTFDPAVDFELRKKFYDIMVQRGIDWWGRYYALGIRLASNGGHNPEYGPKLFYAWCATQDSRIFDCLNFESGNVHNGTKKYVPYEPDITRYSHSPNIYHEFGTGLMMASNISSGTRNFNMKISGVDTTLGAQSITVRRPETAAAEFVKRREYGEPIPSTDIIEFSKNDPWVADRTRMGPWDITTNTVGNPITGYFAGGIVRVNGQTTRVIDNRNEVYYDYASSALFNIEGTQVIDGIEFQHVHTLPVNDHYREFYSMDKVAFKEELDGSYSLSLIFLDDDWKIDKWLSNEQGNYRVSNGTNEFLSSGNWGRTGRIVTHTSHIPAGDDLGNFSAPLTVFENWTSQEIPEELTLYLQTDILNDTDTYTTCDYANISKEEGEAGASLRLTTRPAMNCSTEWGKQSYTYSRCGHTLSIHLVAQAVGGFDTLPKWGQLLWERNQYWASTKGMNVRIFEGDAYMFKHGYYLAVMRQMINDGNIIPTPPVDKPGGMQVPTNWPPLPNPYTIAEVELPENIAYFSSHNTLPGGNPVWIYRADGSKYAYLEKITIDHPDAGEVGANSKHRRIVFDNSKTRVAPGGAEDNEITYQFFLDHDFYVLAHDTTSPVPLTQTFTNATGSTDDKFKVWFKLPDQFVRVTKYGEKGILICERP